MQLPVILATLFHLVLALNAPVALDGSSSSSESNAIPKSEIPNSVYFDINSEPWHHIFPSNLSSISMAKILNNDWESSCVSLFKNVWTKNGGAPQGFSMASLSESALRTTSQLTSTVSFGAIARQPDVSCYSVTLCRILLFNFSDLLAAVVKF